MGYKFKAISGFSWRQVFYIINNLIAIGRIMILARILTPYDFGLFSITAIALGLSEAFTQTGINLTILQSKLPIKKFIDTAWVIAIGRGFLITLLMAGLAYILPHIYQEPNLVFMIALASLIPAIKGFINPNIISLQKHLHFFKNTLYSSSRVVVEATATILLAIYLKNATAFIWGMIISAVFEVIISFVFFKLRPRFKFKKSVAKLILENAKGLTPMAALNYVHENVDNLIIGKILGATNLGYYQNVYALAHKANYQLAQAANHGLLPIFAKIEQDKPRLKKAFFKSLLTVGLITSFFSAILIIWPDFVVNILLGSKWQPSISLLPILALAGFIQGLSMIFYTLFLARARFKPINYHLIATVFLLVIFVWWGGLNFGLKGASWGIVASRFLTLPILIYFTKKKFKG